MTYDEIGNPLRYYNGTYQIFTWDGRRLATAVKGSNSMSFAYNSDGLRVTKTVNGVVTTYYYQGSLLIAEETNSQIIIYLYDSNGAPIGFKYRGSSYASGVSASGYGWFVGGYHTVTNAPTVKNLEGPFTQAGGSAGIPIGGTPIAGGVDVLKMVNDWTGEIYHGASVSGGIGTPGAEAHFETGRTYSFQDIAKFIKLSN